MRRILPLAPLVTLALVSCVSAPTYVAHAPSAPAPVAPPSAPSASASLAEVAATATNPAVGGAPMLGTRTIADNCASAANLRILTRAIDAGGVRQTLSTTGPITVFAPTDQAFDRLASGAVNDLMAPSNRPKLFKVLTYHVVPGAITLDQLKARIDAGGGATRLTTVEGAPLTATKEGGALALIDVNGNKSYVETPDVQQRNGIVHVVNGVLVPRLG